MEGRQATTFILTQRITVGTDLGCPEGCWEISPLQGTHKKATDPYSINSWGKQIDAYNLASPRQDMWGHFFSFLLAPTPGSQQGQRRGEKV
jgi:hypothetical protein